MISFATKAALSMLTHPVRHADRSWGAEYLCRTLRNAFYASRNMPLPRFRRIVEKATVPHPALAKVTINTQSIEGVDCLLVEESKADDSTRVLVYFHGGGYVVGSPTSYKSFLAQLAVNLRCQVVAPDYRLAPEHPFPAPQDDCVAVAQSVFRGHDTQQKILAGDSAGGALAINCALELCREQSLATPSACVLISPWVDPTANSGSMLQNQNHDFLTLDFLDKGLAALMQDTNLNHPNINFRDVDLSTLPPTLIQCGGAELFFDQIQHFANRATKQGVDLECQSFTGQFHVFQVVAPMLNASKSAMQSLSEFINRL